MEMPSFFSEPAPATEPRTGRTDIFQVRRICGEALSDRFLGGSLKDRSLADVAEYAKNESSLDEVQRLVYELFEPLMPASFHDLIPSFRWHAIVTTNYDFIIERAYEANGDALQQVRSIVSVRL